MSPSTALRDEANERISAVLQELIIQRHIAVQSLIALDPEKLMRLHPEFGNMDIFEILQNLEQAGTIRIANRPSDEIDGTSGEHGVVDPIGVYLLEADAATLEHAYDLINPGRPAQRPVPMTITGQPFAGPRQVEMAVGDLASYNDGSIEYQSTPLVMRAQMKDLCRMFIKSPRQLITSDDIYDVLERSIPKNTISKYVSELHAILKPVFGRAVIVNQKKEGWTFSP